MRAVFVQCVYAGVVVVFQSEVIIGGEEAFVPDIDEGTSIIQPSPTNAWIKKILPDYYGSIEIKYGADQKRIGHKEIKKILNLAKENNILKIDTAEVYLKNNNIFKKISKKFQFITKIKPDHNWVSLDYCKKKLLCHFEKFNIDKIETLLFHDDKILLKKNGPIIFKNADLISSLILMIIPSIDNVLL